MMASTNYYYTNHAYDTPSDGIFSGGGHLRYAVTSD